MPLACNQPADVSIPAAEGFFCRGFCLRAFKALGVLDNPLLDVLDALFVAVGLFAGGQEREDVRFGQGGLRMVRKEDFLRRFACRQQERDGKELLVEVTACAELAPDFRRTLTDGFDVGGGFQPACPAAAGVTVVCRDVFDNFGTVFCAVGFAGGIDGDNAVFRAGADVVV